MAVFKFKHIANGDSPTTIATVYTVPADTLVNLREIRLVNSTNADIIAQVKINFTGTDMDIIPEDITVPANSIYVDSCNVAMEAADFLRVKADQVGLTYIFSGVVDEPVS